MVHFANNFAVFGAIHFFFAPQAKANNAFSELCISEESEITMPPSESSEIVKNRPVRLSVFAVQLVYHF